MELHSVYSADVPRLIDPPYKPGMAELRWQGKTDPPKPYTDPEFEGWDTETVDGKAFLAANSQQYREIESFQDLLEFLTGRYARGKRNVWWNLDYDVTAFLKWRPDILEAVTDEGVYREVEDGQEVLFISYIPKKLFKIRRWNKHTAFHYDASQFYRQSLADAARTFLGEEAPSLKADRANLQKYTTQRVGRYCRWDADATKRLAELYCEKLHNLDLYPRHFISQGNLAEQLIRVHADVPTWHDNPRYVNMVAWKALRGAWIDCWRKGTFQVYKYDLKSAYPAVMMQIPDFRDGEWVNEYRKESFVGFHLCDVTLDCDAPPMLATFFQTSLLYPHIDSTVRCWLTNGEIKRLSRYAEIQWLDGTSFVANDPSYSPWEDLLNRLMVMKEEAKDDPAYYLAVKALINSFYGKTAQKVETDDGYLTGKIFNPPAACTTLSECRCWLFDAVDPHWENVISIATDCIMMDRPMRLGFGSNVGDWEIEDEDVRGVFLRPGVYHIEGHEPHTRGFHRPKYEEGDDIPDGYDVGDHIPFWELFDCDTDKIKLVNNRPITSREAVHWNRLGEANVFVDRDYTIKLHDARRVWRDPPDAFYELNVDTFESDPVPFSLLEATA